MSSPKSWVCFVENDPKIERPERIVLTVREAAELLGVSPATAYRMIKAGSIPSIRMPGSRIFVPRRPFERQFGIDCKPDAASTTT